jgi:hypothetical protein
MSYKHLMRRLMGRAGKASRSKRGAYSHVNTRRNKRASHKALRRSERLSQVARDLGYNVVELDHSGILYMDSAEPKEKLKPLCPCGLNWNEVCECECSYDPTFYHDYHLDVPKEISPNEDD